LHHLNAEKLWKVWRPLATRTAARTQSQDHLASAFAAVRDLLEEGPEAVTVDRLAERLEVGPKWIYTYLGNRKAVLAATSRRHVEMLVRALGDVSTDPDPARRMVKVLDLLLPQPHRGACWMLVLAGEQGLTRRGPLARALARALAPDAGAYAVAVGAGVIGILEEVVGPWAPAYPTLRRTLRDMIQSVALFRQASERRGLGLE
jgi:AcrR family transcriptional regulator